MKPSSAVHGSPFSSTRATMPVRVRSAARDGDEQEADEAAGPRHGALLQPEAEEWLQDGPEPLLRYADGEVRMALLTPADWRARHAPDEQNEARLARGLAMYEARQRQIAAVLQAHGIEVQFVQVAAGQDPADALR